MRLRDENKKLAIRQKAIEMIVQSGLDGFSMQKLAKAAGVSPATLYIYYKDREDLILQLCREVSDEMIESSMKNFSPDMPFAEGLKIQWRNRAHFFLEHPLEVNFIEQIRYSPLYEKIADHIKTRFSSVMGKFVHHAVEKGELMPLSFEVYWSMCYAPLYQLIKFHSQGSYHDKAFTLTQEIMDQTLALVLKAVKP